MKVIKWVYNRKMQKIITWFLNQIKAQDFFAEKVSLTQNGEKDYRSKLGGCVSILAFAGLVLYGLLQMLNLYFNPVYNSLPVTIDYDYNMNIDVDWR